MTKISIIIPVYNTAEFVGRCLDSVLDQRGVEFECIVVDDCSPDNAMEIVERRADSRLKIVRHTHNRGLSAARNSGTHAALFDWVLYLDSDDTLPEGALEALLSLATPDTDWVQGSFNRIASDKSWQTIYPKASYLTHKQISTAYNRLNFTNATNKLINRRRIDISFCEGLIFEDSLWCSQAYRQVRQIESTNQPTYNHMIREGSIMKSSFTSEKIESLLFIIGKIAEMQPDLNQQQSAVYNALYLIKNLYLGDFTTAYRRKIMRKLSATGVYEMRFYRNALPRFSRMLSYGFYLPNFCSAIMCRTYGLYKGISFTE